MLNLEDDEELSTDLDLGWLGDLEQLDGDQGIGDVSLEHLSAETLLSSETQTESKRDTNDAVKSHQKNHKKAPKSNAARCREHRERKRQEEEQVFADNARLKREREGLLETITALEYEAQTLRGQGAMDLSVENELLRHEIKKHQKYVHKIVELTKVDELDSDDIETSRVMQSCVESAIARTIGLAYSSLMDTSWKVANPFMITLDEENLVHCKIFPRYQCLPVGSTLEDARLVNLRLDFFNFPIKPDRVVKFVKYMSTRVDPVIERISKEWGQEMAVETAIPTRKIGDNEFTCMKYNMKTTTMKKQHVVVTSSKVVEVYPEMLPGIVRPEGRLEASITVTSSCDDLLEKSETNQHQEKLDSVMSKATIVVDSGDGASHLTNMSSFTVDTMINTNGPFFDDEGELSDWYKDFMRRGWKMMYDKIRFDHSPCETLE